MRESLHAVRGYAGSWIVEPELPQPSCSHLNELSTSLKSAGCVSAGPRRIFARKKVVQGFSPCPTRTISRSASLFGLKSKTTILSHCPANSRAKIRRVTVVRED